MEDVLLDEVKSNKADNFAKISLIAGLLLFICFLAKIILNLHSEKGIGFIFDCLLLLFSSISSFTSFKRLSKRKSQYIKWWSHKIFYKLFDNNIPKEINVSDITSISVGMDLIEIYTFSNITYNLNIIDFTDYNVRARIKENFENLVLNKQTTS
ncbi:hypothetical protein EOD41_09225 [Mucilaginibacter limnophilus]|uniref:DUF304 domain-containing protein n=1 Tax=Mucilaginibacter limnophilus TaxID=1932778 RepID=A0A3S2V1L9_9SPHI|nr:hypothetical protein [Mucilaginibacter limnophilus]RVU00810.1 hypothetical protein EOD41_09225 [Mucilaginibacter limnophilus]